MEAHLGRTSLRNRGGKLEAKPAGVDVWIGLDVGKEKHFATVLDDDGEQLIKRSVLNDETDLVKLFEQAKNFGTPSLVIDQPGSIAQLSLVLARNFDLPVAYIPGLVMRRAADLYPGEAKTDSIDSFVIADTARMRRKQIQWLVVGDEILAQLRVLNGFDIDQAGDTTRVVNRLRDALTSISPALERAIGSKLNHRGVCDLLAKYPTPTALKAAGKTRIAREVTKKSPRMANKVADAVTSALDAQSVTVPAETTIGRVISELACELDRLHERRSKLENEIKEVFLSHPLGEVLVSLGGIGPRTGARILAEIGDGSSFASGAKLASFAGLAPVDRQSGTSIRGSNQSHRGNHRLKNAMFIAAFASIGSGESKTFYDRKRDEGKKHSAIIVALARRRCDVILAMLRTGIKYDPNFLKNADKAA